MTIEPTPDSGAASGRAAPKSPRKIQSFIIGCQQRSPAADKNIAVFIRAERTTAILRLFTASNKPPSPFPAPHRATSVSATPPRAPEPDPPYSAIADAND